MSDVETKISYNTQVERRAGKAVMVITRYVTTTPITKRGYEYSRTESTSETTVLDLWEAEKLASAIMGGFAIEAAGRVSGLPEGAVIKDEPTVTLTNSQGGLLSEHFSVVEAEERAREIHAGISPELITPDLATLAIYRKRNGRVVSMVEYGQKK